MPKYLLDTNIVSEPQKARPHPAVAAWFHSVPADSLFISALTIGEIRRGIERLRHRDTGRAGRYDNWLIGLEASFEDRIIGFTATEAHRWGVLTASGPTLPVVDSQIAATALTHGLVLATRNAADFQNAGVETKNPFDFSLGSPQA